MIDGHALQRLTLAAACALAVLPAWGQYKVVQPDGSVVYTDRPPADSSSRVTTVGPNKTTAAGVRPLAAGGAATAALAGLPAELRVAVQRHPVTLYTAPECPPCDNGRRLLQQRGIPYAERRVVSTEDIQAFERLLGVRTLPSVTIGTQPLRGFAEADWANFLDAAGYPRESRMPKGWKAADATPLTERVLAPAPAPEPAAPPATRPGAQAPVAPAPGAVRF